MKKNVLLLILLGFICSCASTSSSVNVKDIKTNEGLFYGKLSIVIDEEEVTGNCYAGMKDSAGERVYISLDEQGLFSGVAQKGDVYLSELRCRKGMSHYNFLWDKKQYVFQNKGEGKTYFGDTSFEWDSSNDNTNYVLLVLFGNMYAVNHSQDLFTLKVKSDNKHTHTKELLHKIVTSSKVMEDSMSIMSGVRRNNSSVED
ncbi:MAG: hypothetical protein KC478_06435 [Bacteriovoracaceae bacterium]|nr:hypothetical protein [Bacteriovoracaceae bacterium]